MSSKWLKELQGVIFVFIFYFSPLSNSHFIVSLASLPILSPALPFNHKVEENPISPTLTRSQTLRYAALRRTHTYANFILSRKHFWKHTHPYTHILPHVIIIPSWWNHVQGAYWTKAIDSFLCTLSLSLLSWLPQSCSISLFVSTSLPVLPSLFLCNWFSSPYILLSQAVRPGRAPVTSTETLDWR